MSYGPRFFSVKVGEFFDVHPGEGRRIGLMATVLFFLLAANNVIKIVRDSLFLSRFPITQLPYVYLSAGLIAAALIGIYSRYTATISLSQVILRSYVFIISNVVIFWVLITFYDFAWVLYAFYMWSAIVGLVALSQFWTLADEVFNPREGKRLFGILTAAGTLGAISGGLGANLAVNFLFGTKQLLWLIVVPFVAAFGVARFALGRSALGHRQDVLLNETQDRNASGIGGTLRRSQYLRAIAVLIFISITVSTLIDYQFKAAAKEAYNTAEPWLLFLVLTTRGSRS
jgi:AAA family ATP:ADP antiporter